MEYSETTENRSTTDSIEVLVHRWKTPLYTLCYRLTRKREEADDLFQDTWIRIMEKINQHKTDCEFLPWAKTICINLFRDRCRMFNRISAVFTSFSTHEQYTYHYENAADTQPSADDDLNKDALQKCMRRLSPLLRGVLVLSYYEDYSYEEIANVLQIPQGTVKSRINRAKEMLKEYMEDFYEKNY